MGKNILQYLFQGYLKLLKRTLQFQWEEEQLSEKSQIFGFWHEDSFCMNLVLEELAKRVKPVYVIVTADRRGDYIEAMIKSCGGYALRVPDGRASFSRLKEIQENFQGKDVSIAVALDGPLGPRHEPKKLAFYLGEVLKKEFTGVTLSYSSCIRLRHRWDEYAVPLPWSKVRVCVHSYGMVRKRDIPALPVSAGSRKYAIMKTGSVGLRQQMAGGTYGNESYFSSGR